jgi:hypothetical protein
MLRQRAEAFFKEDARCAPLLCYPPSRLEGEPEWLQDGRWKNKNTCQPGCLALLRWIPKRKPMSESDFESFRLEEEARAKEIRANVYTRSMEGRRERAKLNLKQKWPLAAGLILACFAPWLRDLAGLFAPWGTWILLPAISVVESPQLALSSEVRAIAGQFALYGQFPIEAVIIGSILKGRVKLRAVLGQLALFHTLAAVLLWLLSRTPAR